MQTLADGEPTELAELEDQPVATRLDQSGATARQIADHLGHERPSMTQDVDMGPRSRVRRRRGNAARVGLAQLQTGS